MIEMMDITPTTHFLKSIRGQRVNYIVLCGEAVDNSFDAEANQIAITLIKGESIVFQDDGSGITKEKSSALFRLGEHIHISSTQLGRFGIGIKVQAINAGDELEILSTSADGRVRLHADWRKIIERGRWEVAAGQWDALRVVGARTGTRLTIRGLRSAPFDLEKTHWELAMRFHPALIGGRRIILNGHKIPALVDPEITDVASADLVLSGGRTAQLRAGILVRPSRLRGVHVTYKHRVIMPGSRLGCGGYTGIDQIFARLTIHGKWFLEQFKNDLTDEDEREELAGAVLEVMRPILEKVDRKAINARVNEMQGLLNAMIPAELAARPQGQGKKPTPMPKADHPNGEGKVAPEKSNPAGPARTTRMPKNLLQITFDGIAEDHGIGYFDPSGRPYSVNLSRDDPTIAYFLGMRERDLKGSKKALFSIAMNLYLQGMLEQQMQLDLFDEGFGKAVAKLLANQAGNDTDEASIVG